MTAYSFTVEALQVLILLFAAPAFTGWVRTVKCRMQGRTYAGILQPYRNIAKLFSKEVVLAENASWIFRSTPYIVFGVTVMIGGIIPFISTDLPFAATADVIALVMLFAIIRFFTALAGMDIGTSTRQHQARDRFTPSRCTIRPSLRSETRAGVKMLLNSLSTCTMVRLGRVMGNYMIWVVPSNLKLIDRSTRYIQRLTSLDYREANHLLFEVIEYVEPRMKADQAYPPVVGVAVMRIRHGLRLDQPNDFDVVTDESFWIQGDKPYQAFLCEAR